MRQSPTEIRLLLDPVTAYDQLAPEFLRMSAARYRYLACVERLVVREMARRGGALLDVGAGDGVRGLRIAAAAGVEKLVLLEPSAEMRKLWPAGVAGWGIRAEELDQKEGRFDSIVCLWNVLGHVFPMEARVEVMRQCGRLLAPEGRLFVDVNNRFNFREYGVVKAAFRLIRGGDVVVRWSTCSTRGHLFTAGEFAGMARAAGLVVEKTFIVDYSTGVVRRSRFAGNPLYVLRKVPGRLVAPGSA